MIEQLENDVLIDIFFYRNATARLNQIIEIIPFLQQLDCSFWECTEFLGWQLLRLNKVYQEDVCKVWKNYLRYEDIKRGSAIVAYFSHFGEFLPRPKASFMDWVEAQSEPRESFYDEQADLLEFMKIMRGKGEVTKEDLERRFEWFKESWEDEVIWKLTLMDPLPIPWIFRFPRLNYIGRLPISLWKGKRLRGRPPNWAENLLVYELSQAGMKNKKIAELVLGAEKFYRMDKDPIYVRLNTILNAVEKIVSQAYPFPQST